MEIARHSSNNASMELVPSCIRTFAAIALVVMAGHSAPVQAAVATDLGSAAPASDVAQRVDLAVDQNSIGEFDLADRDCQPICPTGCPHSAGVGCCGSIVLALSSVVPAVMSAAGDLPCKADQNLSGVEPDAPQEPPRLSA